MGVRIRGRLLCIVVKDTSKPTVSWLNFEPKVSKFPSTSSQKRLLVRILLWEVYSVLTDIYEGANKT